MSTRTPRRSKSLFAPINSCRGICIKRTSCAYCAASASACPARVAMSLKHLILVSRVCLSVCQDEVLSHMPYAVQRSVARIWYDHLRAYAGRNATTSLGQLNDSPRFLQKQPARRSSSHPPRMHRRATLKISGTLKQQEAKGWRKQAALQDLASKAENSHSNWWRGLQSTDFQRSLLMRPSLRRIAQGKSSFACPIYHPANRKVLKKWRASSVEEAIWPPSQCKQTMN